MKEKSWEYTGRTAEEATQIALEELGLEREDIHVEVLEEPQKSFLGIGGKEARIRVELIGEWEVHGDKVERLEEETTAEEDERILEEEEEFPKERSAKPVRMVQEIIEYFDIDAMVEGKDHADSVVVDVWGDDVALLIGRGGSTLDALQYLVNVACRRKGDVDKRITVDVEGYRKRRRSKLEKQADRVAERVLSEGEPAEMSPMSASERKIIHMKLKDKEGVWTESIGEGRDRRVVVQPEASSST